MQTKFKTLRIVSVILRIIAWIVAALTIIGFIGLLVGGAALAQFGSRYGMGAIGPYGAIGIAFYVLVIGAIWFISLLAAADMIMVLLAIEENTRAAKPTA